MFTESFLDKVLIDHGTAKWKVARARHRVQVE